MALSKKLIVAGLASVGVLAGVAGASLSPLSASAETASGTSSSTSSTTGSSSGGTSTTQSSQPSGAHQANGKTETVLTGTDLEKATAAAKAKVSDATVERVETDADGDGTYEVHMKKPDGSMVTVFLDANFTVTSTTDGMSAKSPAPTSNSQS